MTDQIATEIDELHSMTTNELAQMYHDLHGQPVRTRHRQYLIRKVAWRLQANAMGDLSTRARKRAIELADDADIRVMAPRSMICPPQSGRARSMTKRVIQRDPRIPSVGSAIVRQYKDKTIRVLVLDGDQGFEYNGQRYRSLSSIAKEITGSHMNGFRFFMLGDQA